MLLPRILTAIIGVPLVVAAIHLGGIPYMVFIAAVILLCLYEYGLILRIGGRQVQGLPLVFFGLMMTAATVLNSWPGSGDTPSSIIPLAVNVVIVGMTLWELFFGRSLDRLALTFFGVFLIPWTLSHMINIRYMKHGEYLTLLLFVSVWASDTAAYFVGKHFGTRKLLEPVSPKKTWAGAVAGFVAAVLVSVIWGKLVMPGDLPVTAFLSLGTAAGVVGQLSDLAESMIKRSVGVKDSSSLLPGHGGILDRFDSYLLLAPAYYYILVFFSK